MDRRSHCNNINRNTSHLLNRIKNGAVRNNVVAPEVFVSEIWMQEGTTNGVEIIELNSSNSEIQESLQEPSNTLSQGWNFINHDTLRDTEENYRINNIARERRRKNGEEEWSFPCTNEYLHDTQTNFNGFHYIDGSKISEFPHSQEMNCFTIINNNVINSDSSSDKVCAKVEEIEPFTENNNSDTYRWDHVYKEDIITYKPMNPENRTVWIYSFKNKRRLSEYDFELVNIPSIDSSDTSTMSPMSDEEYRTDRSTNANRIASPIPATFIPRLDLSLAQTLSTVTEISEVKNSSHESLVIKPINNWFTERTIPNSKIEIPSVVNWMALSPRERRRRFKNTNSDVDHRTNRDRREQFTYAEGNSQSEQPKEKSPKMTFSQIQVDVEVHAYDIPVINSAKLSDIEIVSKESLEMEPQVEYKFANTLSNEITYADADTEIDNEIGDNFDPTCRKPCIQLTSENTFIISEPIEKLNGSKWIIGEDTIEEQTAVFDYVLDVDKTENESIRSNESDSASKRLWIKNAKLIKSPFWTEYLPITVTPPSLHLSLSLSSIEGKKSWFKRIRKCFKCFK